MNTVPTNTWYPPYPLGGESVDAGFRPGEAARIPTTPPGRAAPPTRRLPDPRSRVQRRRAVMIAVILGCFLVGYGGVLGVFTIADAMSAVRDAKAQAAAIQSTLNGGHLTETATLTTLRDRLQALQRDLQRIESDEPAQPLFSNVFGDTSPLHALRMAQDLTFAGQYAVDAGLMIAPHIKDIMGSLTASGGKPSATASASGSGGSLTLAEIQRASQDVTAAGSLAKQALAERAHVHDSDLRALGLGSFVHTLQTLDKFAPKLPTYLSYASRILSALPDALGVTKPVNYLLFDLDSDELRPSGGFQGVYGILTFDKAMLASGVHLKNVYALDCLGNYPPNCPLHQLPARYSWFSYNDGLRNANLDPNYPTTAQVDERMLAGDHGPAVAGVISITPVVIERALGVIGPLIIPGYPQKMTASNFSELIHYYHSISGAANVSTDKAFDAAAGAALIHAFSKLSQHDQMAFIQQSLAGWRAGDIQVYFNDPRLQSVLADLKLDGALQTPAGDTYEVVDANHGGTYANVDVTSAQSDQVTLDATGVATHTLTITYHFPVKQHMYTSTLISNYRDVIQVLAPPNAHLRSIRGCAPMRITEPGWSDWSCDLTLWRGASATIVFQWVTPHVVKTGANGVAQYDLLVQRQPGTKNSLDVTVTPPPGARVAKPLPAPLTLVPGAHVHYAAILSQARALSVAWTA